MNPAPIQSETVTRPRHRLSIERVEATYLVPRDHPTPGLLRQQGDELIRMQVPAAAASLLAGIAPASDESVWFIRRLDLDVPVPAEADPTQLARGWAVHLSRSVNQKLAQGDDGADVLQFPNRAAWLAQFLRDLADGVAWSKWYYASLDGLRALPTNAALREAICRDPITGEGALVHLAETNRLESVLPSLTENDCRRVVDTFDGGRNEADHHVTSDDLRLVLNRWRQDAAQSASLDLHRGTLRLYLGLRSTEPSRPSRPGLLSAVRAVLVLGQCQEGQTGDQVFRALRDGDSASALAHARAEDVDALVPLLSCEPALLDQITQRLASPSTVPESRRAATEKEEMTTPFGGIFYLLPHLAELDLESCAAVLPPFQGEPATALVRFLVLLKCLGAARGPRAFYDPVVRHIAGAPHDLDLESTRAWARSVTPEMAMAFQVRRARLCCERDLLHSGSLMVRAARRGRLFILTGGEQNMWLLVTRFPDTLERAMMELTRVALHGSGLLSLKTRPMLCDPITHRQAQVWALGQLAEAPTEGATSATDSERAPSQDADLTYLDVSLLLARTRHLDFALSPAARSVLQNFTLRLPGFASISAAYAYTHFLDVTARIAPGASWVVQLGRPTLHIVLATTGAHEHSYGVPWLKDCWLHLRTSP